MQPSLLGRILFPLIGYSLDQQNALCCGVAENFGGEAEEAELLILGMRRPYLAILVVLGVVGLVIVALVIAVVLVTDFLIVIIGGIFCFRCYRCGTR